MRTDPAGKGETFEECPEAVFVLASIWVDFRVGTLEVRVRENGWGTMTGTRNIEHVQIVFLD